MHEGRFTIAHQTSVDDHHYAKDLVHPITGVLDHYSLYDRFHEKNTKKQKEILRRVKFVPELYGLINTASAEQIHRCIQRDLYYLDVMHPLHHIFLARNMIWHRNIDNNFKIMEDIEKSLPRSFWQR